MTYDSLDDVGKIVGGSQDDRSLFRVVGADFVDPAQDKRTRTGLNRTWFQPSVRGSRGRKR